MSKNKNELIGKHNLEESIKRFQQICEYTFITKQPIDEDGEEDVVGNDGQQTQGGEVAGPQVGAEQEMQEPQNGPVDGTNEQQPSNDSVEGSSEGGFEPQPLGDGEGEAEDIEIDDVEPMQDDDEVIDVDELTQSQEDTEYKIDGVDEKLSTLLDVTSKFIEALKQNDEKIEELRNEFEKRNPTDKEKLDIRSQASSPYNDTPVSFWDKKTKQNPNYDVSFENEEETKPKEFVITSDDVNSENISDKSIYDTFKTPRKLTDFLQF